MHEWGSELAEPLWRTCQPHCDVLPLDSKNTRRDVSHSAVLPDDWIFLAQREGRGMPSIVAGLLE